MQRIYKKKGGTGKNRTDNKTMKKSHWLLAGLFCFTIFTGHTNVCPVQAARTEDMSQSCQIIYFEDGSSLTVNSDDKEMTITGTHVKSTSRISYETVGYHMTLAPTGGYVDGKEHREILLLDKYETITDEVTTSYVLDRQSIIDGAYALFQKEHPSGGGDEVWMEFVKEISVKGGVEFYLHNIFAVIERTGGSGSTVISTSRAYNNLGTAVGTKPRVPGILNAVEELYGSDWSAGTKKKLPEYYDIHLKLYVKPCKTNILLVTEDGQVITTIKSGINVYENAEVRYQVPQYIRGEINYQGEKYQLTQASIRKSFVHYKDGNDTIQKYSLSNKKGLRVYLKSGSLIFLQLLDVSSDVYLVCEKIEDVVEEERKEEITENEETYSIRYMEPQNEIKIQACKEEAPYFEVEDETGGIPANEELLVKGKFWKYLFYGKFSVKKGEITFSVPVRRKYHRIWKEAVGETDEGGLIYETFEDWQQTVNYVPVTKKYSYAEIKEFAYYGISEFLLENHALPEGMLVCKKGGGIFADLVLPEISYEHYDGQEAHLLYPPEAEAGIDLPMVTLQSDFGMPSIPSEDVSATVQEMVSEVKVRSDMFCFDGVNYLTDVWKEYVPGMEISLSGVLAGLTKEKIPADVKSDALRIPEQVENGMHESMAQVTYEQVMAYNVTQGEPRVFGLEEVNGVYVHTPVYCGADWRAENEKYTQLVAPQSAAVQLVLDPQGITSEIWIGISNVGNHSAKTGYGERDYAETLGTPGLSYLAQTTDGVLRNEVRFPFDVFRDTGVLYGNADDTYIPAGSWVAVGQEKVRFYLPEWVTEGNYVVECRSVACNCPDDTKSGEGQANRNPGNYIATDSIPVQVSGRLFGFCLYDIADYPVWEEVFRDPATGKIKNRYENRVSGEQLEGFGRLALYRYFSGVADEYGKGRAGKPYTLPVLVGDHPDRADAAVKAGYTVRFCVTTIGERMSRRNSYVDIVPKFFWVDANGKNRREVDLYYTRRLADGEKYLVKIGSELEQEDIKLQDANGIWLGIPKKELDAAKTIWGEVEEVSGMPIYTYSRLKGGLPFRTLKNFSYRDMIMGHGQYALIRGRGISQERLLMLEQGNYFEYSLPNDVMAAEKDFPVMEYAADYGVDFSEKFWKKEGFLIVSFEITAVVFGNAYLTYANEDGRYCDMWELEGMQKHRRDKNNVTFCFYPGDVLVMPLMDSIRKDYRFGGIY